MYAVVVVVVVVVAVVVVVVVCCCYCCLWEQEDLGMGAHRSDEVLSRLSRERSRGLWGS